MMAGNTCRKGFLIQDILQNGSESKQDPKLLRDKQSDFAKEFCYKSISPVSLVYSSSENEDAHLQDEDTLRNRNTNEVDEDRVEDNVCGGERKGFKYHGSYPVLLPLLDKHDAGLTIATGRTGLPVYEDGENLEQHQQTENKETLTTDQKDLTEDEFPIHHRTKNISVLHDGNLNRSELISQEERIRYMYSPGGLTNAESDDITTSQYHSQHLIKLLNYQTNLKNNTDHKYFTYGNNGTVDRNHHHYHLRHGMISKQPYQMSYINPYIAKQREMSQLHRNLYLSHPNNNNHYLHHHSHHHHTTAHKTRKRDKKMRRPRTNFTDQQLRELENLFMKQKYLNVQERTELAENLALNEMQIKTWYQNRRTKWKRQTQLGLDLISPHAPPQLTAYGHSPTAHPIHHRLDELFNNNGASEYHPSYSNSVRIKDEPTVGLQSSNVLKPTPIFLSEVIKNQQEVFAAALGFHSQNEHSVVSDEK